MNRMYYAIFCLVIRNTTEKRMILEINIIDKNHWGDINFSCLIIFLDDWKMNEKNPMKKLYSTYLYFISAFILFLLYIPLTYTYHPFFDCTTITVLYLFCAREN